MGEKVHVIYLVSINTFLFIHEEVQGLFTSRMQECLKDPSLVEDIQEPPSPNPDFQIDYPKCDFPQFLVLKNN